MNRVDRWKLADELNAYQISLLIGGYDPSEFAGDYYDDWPKEVKVEVSPFLNAIQNAARTGKFLFVEEKNFRNNDDETNWYDSLINVDSFCAWLRQREFVDGFFICRQDEVDRIAHSTGEFYAPKLAAAVRAWNEVTSSPEALNGKTPKKALEIWLRKHANEYGLTSKDGNPNELGIEEICKVANWKPSGGASPTPSLNPAPPREGLAAEGRKVRSRPPTPPKRKSAPIAPSAQFDDDIPF
jgi:hypothetical protein